MDAIFVSPQDVPQGRNGMTFDEFKQFVKTSCNGDNPLYDIGNQSVIMNSLFDASFEQFIRNGRLDLSGKEFEQIASYCKDNLAHNNSMGGYDLNFPRFYSADFAHYLSFASCDHSSAIGLPSTDSKGPMATICFSAAISSQAEDPDACWEFIKTLYSADNQYNLAKDSRAIPLNRKAMQAIGEEDIKKFNDSNELYKKENSLAKNSSRLNVSTSQKHSPMINFDLGGNENYTASQKDIDNFIKCIESISHTNQSEYEIDIILIEEMPAYFTGQKKISAVANIIQDRAQKVLNERG